MDPHIDTAQAVIARHQPRPWLAALRILRCVRGCGPWPCNHWLNADDERRRFDDQTAIQRATDVLLRQGTPPSNRGRS